MVSENETMFCDTKNFFQVARTAGQGFYNTKWLVVLYSQ